MLNKHSNYSQLLLREKKHWSDGIQKEIWEKHKKNSNIFPNGIKN